MRKIFLGFVGAWVCGTFFSPSVFAGGGEETLALFRRRLAETPPTQEAVLKTFGPPQARCADAPLLRANLQKALRLAEKKEERILLDSELHPLLLQTEKLAGNDLDQPSTLSRITELWTYDTAGRGKWASFIGIYFDRDKRVLGWDWLIPEKEPPQDGHHTQAARRSLFPNILAAPFNLIRGVKQAGCEVGRAPCDFLEVSLFLGPRDGWETALQDLRNAAAAFVHFALNSPQQNPLRAAQNLAAEIPVIGSFLDAPLPKKVPDSVDAYFLLGGIHQISGHAQRMDPLEHFLKKRLRTERVYRIPWPRGTMLSVGFSTLNLSYGGAVLIAEEIVRRGRLHRGDRIALFAHSGAIQQLIEVARILNDEGIYVTQAAGVSGVFIAGKAPVRDFEIFYDPEQDRLKWLLGFKWLTPGIDWRRVRGASPAKSHEISGSIDKTNRTLYDGFFDEIAAFFEAHPAHQIRS